jgi:hypothetical protein
MIHADSFMYRGRAATVEFWNYVSTAGVRSSSAFSVGATDDVADRFQSHAPWSDKNIYWDFGDIGTTGRISTNYAPYLDKWTHVALVSNGTDFKAIYLDGKEVASATTADTASGRSSLTIGGVLSTWFHPGTMSEFRIWNTARTVEAIRHDMYRRLPSPQSGLLGYWSLDEGQGASAHDSSGFSHDGLIATDTAWTQGMLPLDPLPVPISGPAIVRIDSSTHRYSAPLTGGNRYAWSVIGGTIVGGAGGADVDVMWTDSSGGIVSLRVDREDGCADSVYMPVGARVGAGVDRDDPVTGLAFTSAPDPFSGSTVIRYTLTRRERVDLAVYSLDGTLVTRLADGIQDAGGHEAVFSGAGLASGVYLCRLGVGDGYLYVKALRLVR